MRLTAAQSEFLREVADNYAHHANADQFTLADVVDWALTNAILPQQIVDPTEVRKIYIARMSAAMQRHTIRLPDGRRVRVRHSVQYHGTEDDGTPVQRTLWAHVQQASPEFLQLSLRQRATQIERDVEQLHADAAYINQVLAERGQPLIQLHLFGGPQTI